MKKERIIKWLNNLSNKQLTLYVFITVFAFMFITSFFMSNFNTLYPSLIASLTVASILSLAVYSMMNIADASQEFYKLYNEIRDKLQNISSLSELNEVEKMLPSLKSKMIGRPHSYRYRDILTSIETHKKYLK